MASIIVVDDDPTVCEVVENRLVLDGHVVRVANQPEEAIDIGRSLGITLFQGFAVDAILGAAAMSDPRRLTMRQAMAMAEAL